jgi:replication-associated recombination protein RarA
VISIAPNAGHRTLAAIESAERLGLPEARIPLSQAVIELDNVHLLNGLEFGPHDRF